MFQLLTLCSCLCLTGAVTAIAFPWRYHADQNVTAYDAMTSASSEFSCVRECMKHSQCDSCAFDRESGKCYLQVQTDVATGDAGDRSFVISANSLCFETDAPINDATTTVTWLRKTVWEMEGEQRCNDDSIFVGNSPTVRCFHTGLWTSDGICRQRFWRNLPPWSSPGFPTVTKPAPGWTMCFNGTMPLADSINYLQDEMNIVLRVDVRLNAYMAQKLFELATKVNDVWKNQMVVSNMDPFPIRSTELFHMKIKAVTLYDVQFFVDGTLCGNYTTTLGLDTVTRVEPGENVHIDVIDLLCDA